MNVNDSFSGIRAFFLLLALALLINASPVKASGVPPVKGVEWQPLAAQVERVIEALDYLGSPVSPETKSTFEALQKGKGDEGTSHEVQRLLDPLCLLLVEINPESRVKVLR